MSILAAVTHTSQGVRPGLRAVIAGVEKVGKTTLTTNAPRALLVPLEVGYSGVSVNMTPQLTEFQHVMQLLDEIIQYVQAGQFPYMSLVIDSVTALEKMIHTEVLRRDPNYSPGNKKTVTMDSALGGYGKGYQFANELFQNFLSKCDQLSVQCGVNVILTCHVFTGEVKDPTAGTYHSWDLLLHSPKNDKTYGKREMLTQWADLVGFLHEPIFVSEGKNMNQAVSQNAGRVLGVSRQPGYVAGNRFNMVEPISMPRDNGWNQLAHAIYQCSGRDYYNRDAPQ
jgi:hypothetical protein